MAESPTDALAALRERHVSHQSGIMLVCRACSLYKPGSDEVMAPVMWPCDTQKALALCATLVEERDNLEQAADAAAAWDALKIDCAEKRAAHLEAEHARLDAELEAMGHKWVNACDKAHNYERELEKLCTENERLSRELHRWQCGAPIEGDYVCDASLAVDAKLRAETAALVEAARVITGFYVPGNPGRPEWVKALETALAPFASESKNKE